MKTSILHISAVLLFILLMFIFPFKLINPGPLISGHQDIQKDCLSCHSPFSGTSTDKCISCHVPEKIGIVTVSGNEMPDSVKTPFHKELSSIQCASCHTDHAGILAESATTRFTHSLLPASVADACLSCHESGKPDDKLHMDLASNCSGCHTTDRWQNARLDHDQLPAVFQKDCVGCHSEHRPADGLHRNSGNACYDCHSTNTWKPSTFDHDQYFRFDRHHPADCQSCHENPENFKEYTCYSCHEHSRARIAGEHREEGIVDFENCAECHRSGDEDDAKRIWRNSNRPDRRSRVHDDD